MVVRGSLALVSIMTWVIISLLVGAVIIWYAWIVLLGLALNSIGKSIGRDLAQEHIKRGLIK
jgi:hypothetical protein